MLYLIFSTEWRVRFPTIWEASEGDSDEQKTRCYNAYMAACEWRNTTDDTRRNDILDQLDGLEEDAAVEATAAG